ncbi:hypothetical protein D3C72_1177880 [compost metagenome]
MARVSTFGWPARVWWANRAKARASLASGSSPATWVSVTAAGARASARAAMSTGLRAPPPLTRISAGKPSAGRKRRYWSATVAAVQAVAVATKSAPESPIAVPWAQRASEKA